MSRTMRLTRAELQRLADEAGPDSPLRQLVTAAKPPRDLEHREQVKLFAWREQHEKEIPELRLLYAIPNFSGRGKDRRRRMRDGARLKAEGRRKGMLDVCLPVARGGFHALYIEIKAEGGKVEAEQKWWVAELRNAGNRAEVVRGFEGACALILQYLRAHE